MFERIVVPLDGSKVGEATLPYVEDLISKLSPEVKVEVILIQVLSSVSPRVIGGELGMAVDYTKEQMKRSEDQAMDYLNKFGEAIRGKGITITAKVAVGNAAEEIVKAAVEVNANFIAMSTHGRTGLSRWAFGSVTDKVLRMGGRTPIIMVKAPK